MICIMTFKYDIPLKKENRFFNRFKINRPKIKDVTVGKVKVRYVEYKIISDRINIRRLQKAIDGYNCVLFDENGNIPYGLKIPKFSDYSLMKKLTANTAVQIVKMKKLKLDKLKLALYDKTGDNFELAYELLKYIPQLTAVTENLELYTEFADLMYYNTGAPLTVSNNKDILSEYNIIFSPDKITDSLNLPYNTYVFTSEVPQKYVGGTVFCNYNVPVPQRYMDLCPDYIDKKVFTCVLHSIEGLKYLEREIPISISTYTGEYSLDEIIKLINKSVETFDY